MFDPKIALRQPGKPPGVTVVAVVRSFTVQTARHLRRKSPSSASGSIAGTCPTFWRRISSANSSGVSLGIRNALGATGGGTQRSSVKDCAWMPAAGPALAPRREVTGSR